MQQAVQRCNAKQLRSKDWKLIEENYYLANHVRQIVDNQNHAESSEEAKLVNLSASAPSSLNQPKFGSNWCQLVDTVVFFTHNNHIVALLSESLGPHGHFNVTLFISRVNQCEAQRERKLRQ